MTQMKNERGKACSIILLIILALSLSCSKIDYVMPVSGSVDIYLAGSKISGPDSVRSATYWKNGIPTSLTNGSANSSLFAIVVSGKDVYTAGYVGDTLKYWKNKVGVIVGRDSLLAGAMAIFGSHVYLAGGIKHIITANNFSVIKTVATYWKDGVAFSLPIESDALQSYAASITVSGEDVYVVGRELRTNGLHPKLWKNGNSIDVTVDSLYTQFESITISGTDIYLAGTTGNSFTQQVATYWKNGVAFSLSTDPVATLSKASSIAVSGADIYVAGWERNNNGVIVAKYWKNGVPTILTDGTISQEAYSIAVSGNDVYVTSDGTIPNSSTLWKNGKVVPPFDGTNNQAYAYGLWIN